MGAEEKQGPEALEEEPHSDYQPLPALHPMSPWAIWVFKKLDAWEARVQAKKAARRERKNQKTRR
jgi:hypothetical protein